MVDVIFLTGYSNDNLQTSKERGILGWKQNSKRKELSKGDYVFVYNVDNKKIDYLFQINSRITSTDLIWKDEIQSNTIKYENRWHVSLIKDNLNIHINEILNLYPFNQDPNRFYLLIKNPFPNFLDERYNDFKSYILKKTKLNEVFIVNEKIEIDPNQTHSIQEGSGSSPMNENYLILRKQKPLDFTKPEFYAGSENLNRNKIIKGSNVIIEGPYKGKNTLLGYGKVISTYKSSTFSSVPFGSTTIPIRNFKKFISLESSLETPEKIKNLLAQIPEYKNPYNSVIEITQEQFHQIVNEYENPNLTFTKNKIETYSEKNDNIQYFLVQVNEAGSENILNKYIYQHIGWEKTPRDQDHGRVKKGDILLVYFASNSIHYKQELRKSYTVDSVSPDKSTFYLKEVNDIPELSLNKLKNILEAGKLGKNFEKLGQQGFNIKQISELEYNDVLNLANENFDNGRNNLPSISYEDLVAYIKHNRMNENYQPVVIKTLVENSNGVDRHQIQNQLLIYNPDSESKSMTETVLSVLINNGIIKREADKYILNLRDELKSETEQNTILNLCETKIKEFLNKLYRIKFWKIAPGENAFFWEHSRNNGIIAIGWNGIEDLTNKTKDDIRVDIKKKFPNSYYSIIPQFEDFISIKEGDIILANNGYSKIIGIGKVIGPYQFRSDLSFNHTYPVKWLDTNEREITPQIGKWRKTISPISPELYHEIILSKPTNSKKINSAAYTKNTKNDLFVSELKPFDYDKKLITLSQKDIDAGYNEISKKLLISKEKITDILIALTSGRHILLAGPIGTGKTELARKIPEIFWKSDGEAEKGRGYLADVHTATADWSTQDVIGGIIPKMKNENIVYEFQYGCALDTIQKNWEFGINGGSRIQPNSHKGIWLVIDEFNRADIDKAFGQLFTALRTRSLKIPIPYGNSPYRDIKIPTDYRIICTLNTADKHFLFRLSDALKSRFAYIEIDIPSQEKQHQEIYYALKNAIDEIDSSNIKSLITFDDEKKIILKEKTNEDLYLRIYQAYNFVSLVRTFKKLGTAILQLIYQHMLIGYEITSDSKQALDNALTSTLIPQLEGLSETEIETIASFCNGRLRELFEKAYKSSYRQTYSKVFLEILKFLKIPQNKELHFSFKNGNLNLEESMKQINFAYENVKEDYENDLNYFIYAVDDLNKSSIL